MDRHPAKPFMWVADLVYLWNVSRGWCSRAGCDDPLQFVSCVGSQYDDEDDQDWTRNKNTWSPEREFNECVHQAWNICGCVHKRCQAPSNISVREDINFRRRALHS